MLSRNWVSQGSDPQCPTVPFALSQIKTCASLTLTCTIWFWSGTGQQCPATPLDPRNAAVSHVHTHALNRAITQDLHFLRSAHLHDVHTSLSGCLDASTGTFSDLQRHPESALGDENVEACTRSAASKYECQHFHHPGLNLWPSGKQRDVMMANAP